MAASISESICQEIQGIPSGRDHYERQCENGRHQTQSVLDYRIPKILVFSAAANG